MVAAHCDLWFLVIWTVPHLRLVLLRLTLSNQVGPVTLALCPQTTPSRRLR